MMDDRARLRAVIRKIIKEEGGDNGMAGGGAGAMYGAEGLMSGPGYGFMNYGGSLKNVFIDPFLDVFKTAKGVSTELATQVKAAAQVAIETILSSLIPLYETNYTAIFNQMDKSLAEVKKKYEKVYAANDEAFRDKDARFLAFLYDPTAWITAKTIGNSPAAAANILEIFTDGTVTAGSHIIEAIRYLKELEMELKGVSRYNRHTPHRLRQAAHSYTKSTSLRDVAPWESVRRPSQPIVEVGEGAPQGNASAVDPAQSIAQKMQKILSDPQLKKEIAASPTAQAMIADGRKILGAVTGQLTKDIGSLRSVNSLEDIARLSQGKVQVPNMQQVPPEEQQAAEAAIVSSTKQALAEFYRKSLEGAIKQAQSEGVGNDNAYVRTLTGLLSKVGQ